MALSQFVSSNSKHQHFYNMQEYLIGEMCPSIPSAYLLTPQPVIFHYYVCTENNTLLTPQSAFLHYIRVYKEITHSSQSHFLARISHSQIVTSRLLTYHNTNRPSFASTRAAMCNNNTQKLIFNTIHE
jgi:hypothetical protein